MRESRQDGRDVDVAIIARLQTARFRKPADRLVMTDEGIRVNRRALIARLRKAGLYRSPDPSLGV